MKVFVAGATGVIGRRTVPLLVEAGHAVTGLARTAAAAASLTEAGARPVEAGLFEPAALTAAVAEHDAVVNLATAIPPLRKARRASSWALNDRIRTEGAANLVDAALGVGAEVVIQEAVAFMYADGGDAWLDESAPLADNPFVPALAAAEASAARFTAASGGGRGIVLRFGGHYGPDTEHTLVLLRAARRGWFVDLGPASARFPYVWTDDAAAAVVAALGAPAGTYNVVDDDPLDRAGRAAALAAAVGRDRLRPIPGIMRAVAGPAAKLLEPSMRASNRRLRTTTGWTPTYRSVAEGWPAVARLVADAAAERVPK